SKRLALDAELSSDRQVDVRQRCHIGQLDVLSADQFAAASPDEDGRKRISVVLVAVRHIRSVQEDRVVEQRSLAVANGGELAQKLAKSIHVPCLNFHQLFDSSEIVGMVRDRVKRIGDADMVVGSVGSFRHHHVRNYASQICAISQRDQLEEKLHLFIECIQ